MDEDRGGAGLADRSVGPTGLHIRTALSKLSAQRHLE